MTEETNIKLSILACVLLLLTMVLCAQPLEISDVSKILDEHNFDEWSTEDKVRLTELILTADQNDHPDAFVDVLVTCPRHVIETFIDLMENA